MALSQAKTNFETVKKILIFLILYCTSIFFEVENEPIRTTTWEVQMLDSMSLEEKIGQLFMVAAYSNKDAAHVSEIEKLISNYHIGGLIFFQGKAKKQLELTNYYQDLSKVPLLIGIDGEWGLNMRLKDTRKYPYQMTLGSLKEDALIYEMGAEIGQECNAMGIHINFAPVADINNNSNNPIINFRSFGENKEKVANYSLAYARGMQDKKVIACAKHFPGHGDTDTDSHKGLPSLPFSKERLDSIELYPFKHLFSNGVISTMVAHISIPAYDNRPNRAASISDKVVTDLLKKEMGFTGLVFTDALNMKGVSKYYKPGELDLIAFEAGNDILLFPEDVPTAVNEFKKAIQSNRIRIESLNERVRRILYWKKWAGLDEYKAKPINQLDSLLHLPQADVLIQKIADNSVCLVNNYNFVPYTSTSNQLAIVTIGGTKENAFVQEMQKGVDVVSFQIKKKPSSTDIAILKRQLIRYKDVIFAFQKPSIWSTKSFGYNSTLFSSVRSLLRQKKGMLVAFSNPYVLKNFQAEKNILVAYEDGPEFQKAAANVILGKLASKGTLPVSVGKFKEGNGIETTLLGAYLPSSTPEKEGVNNRLGASIEPLLSDLVEQRAAPGGQVLVARNGKVIYQRAFGYHTYEKKRAVRVDDIYDLASITKVAATTLSIMKLYEEDKIALDDCLGKYLPYLKGSDKYNITIRDVMLHQARLKSWIPFYLETLSSRDSFYSSTSSGSKCVQVADDLYADSSFRNSILEQIKVSPLYSRKKYKYSDLGFILLRFVLEGIVKEPLEKFVEHEFYGPLGLTHTTFKPLDKYNGNDIVPTDDDTLFRKQLLKGYVHDPACALLGGVAGHVGLFSNAQEVAVLFQMLLNRGEYKGIRYLKKATVDYFTSKHGYKSRRGIGFDKRENNPSNYMNLSNEVSLQAFGHTGFTGTCVWVDPKYDLVYVFLSNRIHPNQENRTLISGNYRTEIQKKVYEALIP